MAADSDEILTAQATGTPSLRFACCVGARRHSSCISMEQVQPAPGSLFEEAAGGQLCQRPPTGNRAWAVPAIQVLRTLETMAWGQTCLEV